MNKQMSEAVAQLRGVVATLNDDELDTVVRVAKIAEELAKHFTLGYADRDTAKDDGYVRPYEVSEYAHDDRMSLYVDLREIARSDDAYDQTPTYLRSNYRRLIEDYPQRFTPVYFLNQDGLGAFVEDLLMDDAYDDDWLVSELVKLKDGHPIYDEDDLSDLEMREIEESVRQYVIHDVTVAQDVIDKWAGLSEDDQAGMVWAAVEATEKFPEHGGLDIHWDYDAIGEHITDQLRTPELAQVA